MKTSKPFSTISYNSNDFLTLKLDDLVHRRKIAFYAYVHHLREDDETKEHKHLYIVPNGQVNTDEVLDYLLEYDATHPDKPLGCIPCHSSKFTDWFLYSSHDKDYLASKGQSRRFNYQKKEFHVSDADYFNEEIHRMDLSHLTKIKALRTAVENDVPFEEMLMNGQIPVQQVYAYRQAYDTISGYLDRTERGGRTSHQIISPRTGEVLDFPIK